MICTWFFVLNDVNKHEPKKTKRNSLYARARFKVATASDSPFIRPSLSQTYFSDIKNQFKHNSMKFNN